jgi:prepilin-type N-terminal cleavage/methylation domain-containing protein
MTRAASPFSARAAFTLVEVLLALVLLAALLTAMNQFVFSITEAWTKSQTQFVFVQHTRAVTRHLDQLMQSSANSARASNTTVGGVVPEEYAVPEAGTENLLAFDLPVGDRLLTWPGAPLPEVHCALGWREKDGLVLYWKSRLEADYETMDPRIAVVSPFVTALTYDYYDKTTDTWSTEEALQKEGGTTLVAPRRVRLNFKRGDREYEEVITLPEIKQGLPAY